MKFSNTLVAVTALGQCANAVAIPDTNEVAVRRTEQESTHSEWVKLENLWKRKGGGASGGRGGSSGSSSGSSGSSGSSSSGSSSSGSSSSGSSSSASGSGRGSSSSNSGGSTTSGSGVSPKYGSGGTSYGGGAKTPYRSGSTSPSGIVPGLLVGSALGFWGTYWLIGAYHYPYSHPYNYYNHSSNQNETKPVECLCRTDQECGCDDNSSDTTYMDGLIGDGNYTTMDKSLVNVATVNGTDTIYINGTLANGTTASGGTESADSAAGGMGSLLQTAGWWPLAATAIAFAYVA